MNEIVNKFLLAGDKFMPEMHLKQPGFTYSVTDFIYRNDLNKACFQHDIAHGEWKDLTKRTQLDKFFKR